MNFENRKFVRTIQIILGLYLVVIPLIGLFFTPPTLPFNEAALSFMSALMSSGYVFGLMNIVFALSGLMFIFNKWSAFGAVILFPLTVNIVAFHLFLDFSGFWMALVFAILNVYLIVVHRDSYKPMFK